MNESFELSRVIGRFRKFSDADKRVVSKLRREGTAAENRFWSLVRENQTPGLKFRRQHKIGKYIVDFFSIKFRLAVEIDGDIHLHRTQEDAVRSQWLESMGIRVLRFSNEMVFTNPELVMHEIQNAVSVSIH